MDAAEVGGNLIGVARLEEVAAFPARMFSVLLFAFWTYLWNVCRFLLFFRAEFFGRVVCGIRTGHDQKQRKRYKPPTRRKPKRKKRVVILLTDRYMPSLLQSWRYG